MKATNYLFNPDNNLLIITDENNKPVSACSGRRAIKRYRELRMQKKSITDIKAEMELCKSVLLNSPEDLPVDIRADYQRRYRQLKKAVETAQTELLTKN